MKQIKASITRYSAGYSFPRELHDFVEKEVHNKTCKLEIDFSNENRHLPKDLLKISFCNKIIYLNRRIEYLRKKHNFKRVEMFDFERKNITFNEEESTSEVKATVTYIDDDGIEKIADYDFESGNLYNVRTSITKTKQEVNEEVSIENTKEVVMPGFLIDSCVSILKPDEFEEYRKFQLPENSNSFDSFLAGYSLPKISLIINFLSLVRFYDKLLIDYNDLMEGKTVLKTIEKYQFKTTLKRAQICQLYKSLINAKLIDVSTQEKTFLFAFGIGEEIDSTYIGWKGTKNLAPYLIEELGKHIINMDKKWKIGENIFGIKHMAKMVDKYFYGTLKPKNHKIIDEILAEIFKNKES